MTLIFDWFGDHVEQSLNDRFGTSFRRLISCLGFVQTYRPIIRLMSNKKDRNFYEDSQFLPRLNWLFDRFSRSSPSKGEKWLWEYYAFQAMIAHRWPSDRSVKSYKPKEIVETFLLRLINWAHQGLSITLDKHALASELEPRIGLTRTRCFRTRRIKSALLTIANQIMQWIRFLWKRYHDKSKVTQTGKSMNFRH